MTFSKRMSNMELLRIISIFFIIIFHSVYKGGFIFSSSFSFNKLIVKSFWMLGELGVNLFVLITGYFMVNSKFKLKKLIILLAEVLFYSLLTVIFAYFIGIYEISNFKDIFLLFFPTLLNKYWFITAYIIIYVLSPYLNILITAMNKVQYKKLLLLLIFLYSIIPTFFGAFFNSSESMLFYNRLIWLIIIYLLGAYIKLYSIKIISTKKRSIFLVSISFLILILSILIIDKFEKIFSIIGIKEIAYLWTPNNIFMLLLSLGMFNLFTYIKIPTNRLINKIASTTLGIYLLHDGVLAKWLWLDVFKIYSYQNSKILIIDILCISFTVFIICMLIDLIRQFIEKYTIVNILNSKLVNKSFNKLKNKVNLILIEEGEDMLNKINKGTIIKWISIILISISFSMFSFYQIVKYENLYIIFTVLISFISVMIFTKKTINNTWNYIKKNPKKSILILAVSIIIVLAMHESKGVLYKDYTLMILRVRIFRLRYWLFTIPSIFYLLVWLYEKINKFIIEFKKGLTKKDKKLYFYITIISSALIFISYLVCDKWYQQYDIVYSIDSGYIYENMIPNLGYYDIRHPFLTIFIFPIWAICKFITTLLVPSQLASCFCVSIFQILNVQLLLIIAFMLKQITKNKWILYLYLFSSPVLLFTMFLEKYQLCTFLLVLYVYLYLKNNKDRENNLILATSIMPTSAFIYFHEILHNSRLIDKLKNLFKTLIQGFSILICFGKIHLINPNELISELTKMTQTFSSTNLSLDKCFIAFFNMIHSSLLSLSSVKSEFYLWTNVIDKISILGVIIFIILIIGTIANRKDKFVKICIVWVIVSLALFTVFKWSVHESPLFGIYFSWAIIPLFQKGLDVIVRNLKWNDKIVYPTIISIMAIINVLNIVDIALFFR